MTPHPLARKLHLKAGQRALILNAPPAYVAGFVPLPDGAVVSEQPAGTYSFVQVFARNRAELATWLATAQGAAEYDALFWVCYPKGGTRAGTDINRDRLHDLVAEHGLNAVTQIAIDRTWSALRFRPAERVGQ